MDRYRYIWIDIDIDVNRARYITEALYKAGTSKKLNIRLTGSMGSDLDCVSFLAPIVQARSLQPSNRNIENSVHLFRAKRQKIKIKHPFP